jgi:TrmH family RNA methyltransferase
VNVITSLSNPKIKEAVKLREGKYRRRTKKFVIDGIRELDRAIQAGIRIHEIFTIHHSVPYTNVEVRQVTEAVFRKISYGDREDGIVAVAEEPVQAFDDFEAKIKQKPCPLLAIVEKISKPGNLGAVFRSADAAGIDGIMIADLHLDPFHYNSIRSSLGTVFHMPMVSEPSISICHWLKEQHFQIAAAWCSGNTVPYTAIDFCRPTAIVLGSEADGLSDVWGGEGIVGITLPMLGIADSLNVSVAAGILFYEARRQREACRK